MVSDIDLFMDEFEGDIRNLLLRLARIWQTVVTGVIDRKDRAAEWAQERLPPDDQRLMERARTTYLGWQPDDRERSRAICRPRTPACKGPGRGPSCRACSNLPSRRH